MAKCSFGETGTEFFKSTYFDKTKVGNALIDFDIKTISSLLDGKTPISSEKIAGRIHGNDLNSPI
jgi:hypothetical protein